MIKTNWLIIASFSALQVAAIFFTELHADSSKDAKSVRADLHVVVKQGDNLTTIVKKELGSLEFWQQVAKINNMSSPDSLKPGDVIVIPWELLQTRNYARVVFVKGKVALRRRDSDEVVPVKKGDKVYIGDTIATGDDGFVSLSFKSESLVNIQTDSQAQLKELDCYDVEKACVIKLHTETSDMKIDVKNVGFIEPTNFTIETPYASAAVRGTEFDFSTRDGNILGVTEGVVVISADDATNNVPIGKGTLAGEGRSVTRLYDLPKEPKFNDSPRISAQDFISWQPVEESALYEVVFASNESLSDIIQSDSGDDLLLVAALPTEGSYFVGARAVDENGFKGFTAIKQINPLTIDSNVAAPELDVELLDNNLKVKPNGRLLTEVHIGSRLNVIDGLETLVEYKSYDIAPGDTLELIVDPGTSVFLTSRAVIDRGTVSEYGGLYELTRAAK